MARFSPQRELILDILHATKAHPSAAIVYEEARKKMPNISLGTVYRNLEKLSQEGIIENFIFKDISHFDGDKTPHPHFCCKVCGKVFTPTRSDGVYCSNACRQKAYRQGVTVR